MLHGAWLLLKFNASILSLFQVLGHHGPVLLPVADVRHEGGMRSR